MAKKSVPVDGKRAPLDREHVLRAALAIADADGLEALSMRRLGRALGVEAMSLYNHVANKDEILAGLVDRIVGDIEFPKGAGDWKAAMRKRAVAMRRTFARHPWALGLLESRRTVGPAALRYFDSVLGVLRRAGFPPAAALRAFSILDSYAYGFVIQEKNLPTGSPSESREVTEEILREFPMDDLPHLGEIIVGVALKSGVDLAEEFEAGLDLILGGLEGLRGKK